MEAERLYDHISAQTVPFFLSVIINSLLRYCQKDSKVGREKKSNKLSLCKWENNINETEANSSVKRFLKYLWVSINSRYQTGKKACSTNHRLVSLLLIPGKIWRIRQLWILSNTQTATNCLTQYKSSQAHFQFLTAGQVNAAGLGIWNSVTLCTWNH